MYNYLLFYLLPARVLAANAPAIEPAGNPRNNLGFTGAFDGVYDKLFTIASMVAGAVAVIFLIYYGILYITSGANPDNQKKGKSGVINSIIGIVIIVGAYAVIRLATTIGSSINGVVR